MSNFQVVIDPERCKGCEFCIKFCPKNILKLDKKNFNSSSYHPAVVEDIEKCKGCGICGRDVCPEAAIEIYKLEGVPNEKVNDR